MKAWNLLQLPGMDLLLVTEMLGIDEIDILTEQLLAIDTFQRSAHGK